MSPRRRLQRSVSGIIGVASLVIMAIFSLRLFRGMQQACIIFATDNAPMVKQLLHQAFVRDPESSDDDEHSPQGKKVSHLELADTTDTPTPLQFQGAPLAFPTPRESEELKERMYTSAVSDQSNVQLAFMSHQMATPPQSYRTPPQTYRQTSSLDTGQPRGWGRGTGAGASQMQERLDNWRAAQSRVPNSEASTVQRYYPFR